MIAVNLSKLENGSFFVLPQTETIWRLVEYEPKLCRYRVCLKRSPDIEHFFLGSTLVFSSPLLADMFTLDLDKIYSDLPF